MMRLIGPTTILTKMVLAIIGLWFLVLCVLFIFPHLIPMVSGFATVLSLPVALVLLLLSLIALFVEKYKLLPSLSLVLIPMVFYLAIAHMLYWGARVNLYIYKDYYEATAKKMLAAQNDNEREQICGEKCWMIAPGRVGFHYVHSFLSWKDIVYDPSGVLVKPMSHDERFRLGGQYFIRAEHLTGDWYLQHDGD